MRAGDESRWNGENLENLCRKKRLMFLATRDLAYAKGRFALIGGVIALITLLVVMLTGLAAGLGKESVSAIDTLPSHGVDQIGFSAPAKGQKVGYDSSHVEAKDIDKIKSVKGVTDASPLTITQGRASVSGVPSAVAVWRYSLPPTMIGEPTPLPPGSGTFHSGFFGSIAGTGPSAVPDPFGPRNRGQSAAESGSASVSARKGSSKRVMWRLGGWRSG